jgi:hypothetical protein
MRRVQNNAYMCDTEPCVGLEHSLVLLRIEYSRTQVYPIVAYCYLSSENRSAGLCGLTLHMKALSHRFADGSPHHLKQLKVDNSPNACEPRLKRERRHCTKESWGNGNLNNSDSPEAPRRSSSWSYTAAKNEESSPCSEEVCIPPSPANAPPPIALVEDIMDNMGVGVSDATTLAIALMAQGGVSVEGFYHMEESDLSEVMSELDPMARLKVRVYVDASKDDDETADEYEDHSDLQGANVVGGVPRQLIFPAISDNFVSWYTPQIVQEISVDEAHAAILARFLLREGKCDVRELHSANADNLALILSLFDSISRGKVDLYLSKLQAS